MHPANKRILQSLRVLPTDLMDHARAIWPKVRPLYKNDALPERFDDAPVAVRNDVIRLVREVLASIEAGQ